MTHRSVQDEGQRDVSGPASVGERPATAEARGDGKLRRRIRALGVWGFLFFLVKGLLWLAIPAAIAAWRWLAG